METTVKTQLKEFFPSSSRLPPSLAPSSSRSSSSSSAAFKTAMESNTQNSAKSEEEEESLNKLQNVTLDSVIQSLKDTLSGDRSISYLIDQIRAYLLPKSKL